VRNGRVGGGSTDFEVTRKEQGRLDWVGVLHNHG
jgi:hypothetical protein